MGKSRIRNSAVTVIALLQTGGRADLATELQALLSDLDRREKTDAALRRLIDLCHAKTLGEVHVEGTTWDDWLTLLGALRNSCEHEFRRHRAAPPPSAKPRAAKPASGPNPVNWLLGGVAAVLALFLAYAVAAIVDTLPDFSPPPLIDVAGDFARVEPVPSSWPGGLKGRIYLQDREVAYDVNDGLGFGWAFTARALKKGDAVTLLVGEAALDGDTGSVPVWEIRVNGEATYSRLGLTKEAKARRQTWAGTGVLAFLAMLGLWWSVKTQVFSTSAMRLSQGPR